MKFLIQLYILFLAFFSFAANVGAAAPELLVYVTDQDKDIYVALYNGIAVELPGCTGETAARALLQLEPEVNTRETTFTALTEENELGRHPGIPCGEDTAFDADLPATVPIWADLTGSKQYYLSAPNEEGMFYAVPIQCEGIKSAFAVRQRIQLPGVLQDIAPPPNLTRSLTFDCGSAPWPPVISPVEETEAVATWTLHRVDIFLSASSMTPDSIYVARFTQSETGGAYLPIYRIDGKTAGEIIWNGGNLTDSVEAGLRKLFSIAPDAPITPLGAETLVQLQSMPFIDLCLTDCATYEYQHTFFVHPGVDPDLSRVQGSIAHSRINLLGHKQQVWNFAPARSVTLAQCGRLSKALGLRTEPAPDWTTLVEDALHQVNEKQAFFQCVDNAQDICVRQLPENGVFHDSLFKATGECANSTRLRLELPATVNMTQALFFVDIPFNEIEMQPASGISRSVIRGIPSIPAAAGTSACMFAPMRTFITTKNLQHLTLSHIDFLRSGADSGEVAALEVQNGTLALDQVDIGISGEEATTIERGIRLCNSKLYVLGGKIEADILGIQSEQSLLMISGSKEKTSEIRSNSHGIQLASTSSARLHAAKLVAQKPLVLRRADLKATQLDLLSTGNEYSYALQMGRNADAVLTTSTAHGFRCLGFFTDQESKIKFILPGNDLRRDNVNIYCGHDNVLILE